MNMGKALKELATFIGKGLEGRRRAAANALSKNVNPCLTRFSTG